MNKYEAYDEFWNGFGVVAYDQSSIPDEEQLPYITYEMVDGDFRHPVSVTATLWWRSTRWDGVTLKYEEISERIGRGGVMVRYDDGAFWIKKGTPFGQRITDEKERNVRGYFMNVEVEFID